MPPNARLATDSSAAPKALVVAKLKKKASHCGDLLFTGLEACQPDEVTTMLESLVQAASSFGVHLP
jgi:hypothetical protein